MHTRPEKTVEETLRRLGVDAERAETLANEVVEDLRSAGWKVEGVYFDRTGGD